VGAGSCMGFQRASVAGLALNPFLPKHFGPAFSFLLLVGGVIGAVREHARVLRV
jgi:hypothetical protein